MILSLDRTFVGTGCNLLLHGNLGIWNTPLRVEGLRRTDWLSQLTTEFIAKLNFECELFGRNLWPGWQYQKRSKIAPHGCLHIGSAAPCNDCTWRVTSTERPQKYPDTYCSIYTYGLCTAGIRREYQVRSWNQNAKMGIEIVSDKHESYDINNFSRSMYVCTQTTDL